MEKMNKFKKGKKDLLDETMFKKPSTFKCIRKYISGTTLEKKRNTNLARNIVMAAPIIMNSALEIYI